MSEIFPKKLHLLSDSSCEVMFPFIYKEAHSVAFLRLSLINNSQTFSQQIIFRIERDFF